MDRNPSPMNSITRRWASTVSADTAYSRAATGQPVVPARQNALRRSVMKHRRSLRSAALLSLRFLLVATAFFPCSAAAAPWEQRSTGGLLPRRNLAAAYDTARGVTVLFGGEYTDGIDYWVTNETWEWNGSSWTLRSSTGPSPRVGPALAYDIARGVTVLFGGNNGDPGTWEWNGSTWTRRSTTGPPPCYRPVMAYDAARAVTVLFGGYYVEDGGPGDELGDTWGWNGSLWTLRSSTGPSPRQQHAMAYDAARGVTVLFGGLSWNGYDYYADTWELGPTCNTCTGDINGDNLVDGQDVAGWVRCTLETPLPGDACLCTNEMTLAQFVDRLLNAASTACP